MTWKFSSLCFYAFFFAFCNVLAFHYAQMKTPTTTRGLASTTTWVQPWYDASFKI